MSVAHRLDKPVIFQAKWRARLKLFLLVSLCVEHTLDKPDTDTVILQLKRLALPEHFLVVSLCVEHPLDKPDKPDKDTIILQIKR